MGSGSGPGLPACAPQNYKQAEALAQGTRQSVKVACPSCKTRFQLDPAKLQPVGRHVRCAKCGHRWLQLPEGMELPAGLMPPESTETEDKATPVAESPRSEPSTPEPSAEPAAAEAPTNAGEPEPSSASPPETPAEMAESLAAIAEQVAAAGQAPAVEKSTPGGFAGPVQRVGARMTGPIIVPPRMKPARPARRSSGIGVILIVGVVIGLVVAAYLLRDVISRVIPGTSALYSIFGVSTDSPADDLEISIDKVDAQDDGGKRFFSVTATVFNLSEYPVDVPPLTIVPVDEAGNPMEPIRFRLSEKVAEPGQNIRFQKSFDDWPINAKSFVLTVEDAP